MPRTPSLPEVIQQILETQASEIRAIDIGEVKAWDNAEQFATIQPLIRDKEGVTRAVIHKVPVIQPTVYHDIQVGEVGLLLICDKDPSRWWRDNQESDPETAAIHSVSNAVFIPGLRSMANARTIPADTAVLEKPAIGGEVHLGVQGATKAVLHEDLLAGLNGIFTALELWGITAHANWGIAAGAFNTNVKPFIDSFQSNQTAGAYESPSVKVED